MGIKVLGRELLSRVPLLDGLFRRFIWSRIHFPETEMRFLNSLPSAAADVCIDVGAAMGSYSWIMDRIAKKVYAFEPGKEHYQHLKSFVFGTNIEVLCAAVGSVSGRANLYTPGSDTNALHSATLSHENPVISEGRTSIEQVDQLTLDGFLSERLDSKRSVDVLKVDVEGYEREVFRGALRTLSRHHPLIICEIEARHNPKYAEVFDLLKKAGYDCYFFREGQCERFDEEGIEGLQLEDDLKVRIGKEYDPKVNKYISNFVFQHPQSRIKVKK